MNRTTKIILGVIGTLVIVCLCAGLALFGMLGAAGAVLANNVRSGAADVTAAGHAIADYQVPAGYIEDYAANMIGFSMAAYRSPSGEGHLFIAQVPAYVNASQAQVEQMARQVTDQRYSDRGRRVKIVSQTGVSIRGQQVTLVTSEGTNGIGKAYRSATAFFQGKNGAAMVNFSTPLSDWDQSVVDAIIASIR